MSKTPDKNKSKQTKEIKNYEKLNKEKLRYFDSRNDFIQKYSKSPLKYSIDFHRFNAKEIQAHNPIRHNPDYKASPVKKFHVKREYTPNVNTQRTINYNLNKDDAYLRYRQKTKKLEKPTLLSEYLQTEPSPSNRQIRTKITDGNELFHDLYQTHTDVGTTTRVIRCKKIVDMPNTIKNLGGKRTFTRRNKPFHEVFTVRPTGRARLEVAKNDLSSRVDSYMQYLK